MTKAITQRQKKHLSRLVLDSFPNVGQIDALIERFCPDLESAQRLLEAGGELKVIRKLIADIIEGISNPPMYADQVVPSNLGYYSGYRMARPVPEQIAILKQKDWGRSVNWRLNQLQKQFLKDPLPIGVKDMYALVFDPIMITHYEENSLMDQSVPVGRAVRVLKDNYPFSNRVINMLENGLGPQRYRRNKRSAIMMRKLWEFQGRPSGIILVPGQLGLAHRGESFRRTRAIMRGPEFGADAFEALQILCTHDNRLDHSEDLGLLLPGGEYSTNRDNVFDEAVCVRCVMGHHHPVISFDSTTDEELRYYGSVTFFLPQQLVAEL